MQQQNINLMNSRKNKSSVKQKNLSFNQSKILQDIFTPYQFDVGLTTNPFLKDQQKFQFLLHKIKEYNKSVLNSAVTDSYYAMVYERLHSLVSTLSNLLTKDVQIERLNSVYDWFVKQQKLLEQRKNQGEIRYKVTKQYLDSQANKSFISQSKNTQNISVVKNKNKILSQLIADKKLPFKNSWRTAHKQLETADVRLLQYNRKSLKLAPYQYTSEKETKKMPKITYPKIQRLKYQKEVQIDIDQQQGNGNENVAKNPQNPESPPVEGQKKSEQLPTGQTSPAEQQPQQDLGLGEEPPEQPEQQEEQQAEDKLAPRLKNYVFEPKEETKEQRLAHKRMNDKILKIENDFLRKQKEDSLLIELMNNWGVRKAQLDKQIMKRLQMMKINYDRYALSNEEPPKQQAFPAQDAKKYGLSKTFEVRKMKSDLDLSQDFELPSIKNKSQIYQKSIRHDKLSILKKKFGKMLNLQDHEERQVSRSMCQIEDRRKGFSQILRRHSKQKERLNQLDEVVALKQKLARQKISIDITALSNSLCCPQQQPNLVQYSSPTKALLSNPFWVEPAKKKKKK